MAEHEKSSSGFSTIPRSQFLKSYNLPSHEKRGALDRIRAVVADGMAFNPDWMRAKGWRAGLWAVKVEFDEDQERHICRVAQTCGEQMLLVTNPYDKSGKDELFRVPASEPSLLDNALRPFSYTTICIVPERQSFAITHLCDEIICYAAPPELMPALSLQDSAEAEWAHVDGEIGSWPNGWNSDYARDLLAANDGFWWWR
jgi:hypothetical protein